MNDSFLGQTYNESIKNGENGVIVSLISCDQQVQQ